MKRVVGILILILAAELAGAQKEANYWYFGRNAGLLFDQEKVSTLTDGQLSSLEGCSTISNEDGQLLFYTDGEKVWNRNHEIMPNGKGLYGNRSSTQSCLIVGKPGNKKIYYIFTVDAIESNPNKGLCYSEVDLTLENGLGDVTKKNILLTHPVSEKISAVYHANKYDIWVAAHKYLSNEVYCYKVGANGVGFIPVISSVSGVNGGSEISAGQMKFSPDGSYLAIAKAQQELQILHFDNITGKVLNIISLNTGKIMFPYGVAWSASARFLYVSGEYSNIIQFDMEAKDIQESMSIIADGLDPSPYAMQLAPDKKIYVALNNAQAMSRIEFPEKKGQAAQFTRDLIELKGATSSLGLPSFVQSFLDRNNFTFNHTCLGEITLFKTNVLRFDSMLWNFGDTMHATNTSNKDNPQHYYADTGYYSVQLLVFLKGFADTIVHRVHISDPTLELGADTVLCRQNYLRLETNIEDAIYEWQDGFDSAYYEARKTGLYSVKIDLDGCIKYDSRRIEMVYPDIDLGPDTLLCNGVVYPLYTDFPSAKYSWQDGSRGNSYLVSEPGTYSVLVDIAGCTGYDEINIYYTDCSNPVIVPNVFTPNNDGKNDVFLPVSKFKADEYQLIIFNRWGQKVFETDNQEEAWDGTYKKHVLPGTYIYRLYFKQYSQSITVNQTGYFNLLL